MKETILICLKAIAIVAMICAIATIAKVVIDSRQNDNYNHLEEENESC